MMEPNAPNWARGMHREMQAEIEAMERRERYVCESVGGVCKDVTPAALIRMKARLQQVRSLFSSFEG
jgi:hypothetical protein